MNEFDIIRQRRRRGEGQKKEQPLDIKFEVTLVNLPILRPSNPRFPSRLTADNVGVSLFHTLSEGCERPIHSFRLFL